MNNQSHTLAWQAAAPAELAGQNLLWARAAALVLDLAILGTLHLGLFLLIGSTFLQVLPLQLGAMIRLVLGCSLLFLVGPGFLALAYFTVFQGWAGTTPGKVFLGLRVVAVTGRPPTPGQAFLRTTGYLLSALPLLAGFLWAVLDADQQTWHDKLARTRVIAG